METTTRRSLLRGGLLLSLAAVPPLRTLLVEDVAAGKNTGKKPASIKSRVQSQRELCAFGGGTFSAKKTPFGSTITTCTGGDKMSDGLTCVNTKKSTTCSYDAPPPPPGDNPTKPPFDAPPPPLEPNPPYTNPGDVPDVPLEPDDGGLKSSASSTYGPAGDHSRRRHGRGKGRKH